MRSFKVSVALGTLLLIMTPQPAHAWFGWLDYLSGPGRFRGPQFEFRLVCFGEESDAKRLIDDLEKANVRTARLAIGDRTALAEANEAWEALIAQLDATRITFPVLDSDKLMNLSREMRDRLRTFSQGLPAIPPAARAAANGAVGQTEAGQPAPQADALDPVKYVDNFIQAANTQVAPYIAAVVRGTVSASSTGVLLSACSADKQRRSSIELGANFWHADGNDAFAQGQEIRLTTLMPLFSFRVFTDPRFDFVDAGVGAGVYWFTSKGFDSFSGVVLQPGRADFHAPTLWSTYSLKGGWTQVLRRIAAAPTFRIDLMTFPAGFGPDAFAGVGDRHVRIPAELIRSWTLFINVEPFVRKPPFVKKGGLPQ